MSHYSNLGRSLLLAFTVVMFLSVDGYSGQTKKVSKSLKPAKSTTTQAFSTAQLILEPKAVDILKSASSRLAAARTMSFTAAVSYESMSRLATPLIYMTRSEVILQRPDKLRVITPGDGPATEFYYDGKNMVAFAPGENLVASAPAPPTIDAALEMAYDDAAIYFPFTDVIVEDPYKDIADGLITAFYIGQSNVVGGVTTDMVAYANSDVFIQAWIGVEDKLPRMLRAVYRTDPEQLRYQLELSNWQLDLAIPADTFTATAAGSARPILFAHPNPKPIFAIKPPGKGKPSKTKATVK